MSLKYLTIKFSTLCKQQNSNIMRENNDEDLDRRSQSSLQCSYRPPFERNEGLKLPDTVASKTTTQHVVRKLAESSKRRRVKFDFVETIPLDDVPLASEMTMKEKGALWWNKDDFRAFKSSMKIMSKSMRSKKGASGASAESSHESTIGRLFTACMNAKTDDLNEMSMVDRDLLLNFARDFPCRRGLERKVVLPFRSDVREEVIRAVNYLNKTQIDPAIKAKNITDLCTRMHRPSRLFARCLALIDAECMTPNEKKDNRSRTSFVARIRRCKSLIIIK
jgi:hypothetical protein